MAGDVWSDVRKFIQSIATQGQNDYQDELARSVHEMQSLLPQLRKEFLDREAGRALLERPDGSFATSDEILVAGEPGLRFFERFIPVYNAWTYSNLNFETDFLQRYHKFRGIGLAAYRADVERFATAGSALGNSHGRMKRSFTGLITQWSGDASRAAGDHVDKFRRASDSVTEWTRRFSEVAADNVAVMERTVRSVAKMTAELWEEGCGGHSPGSADKMIKIVRGKSDSPLLNFLGTGLDIVGGGVKSASGMIPRAGTAAGAAVDLGMGLIGHFRKCLTEQFQAAFEKKQKRFYEEICTASENTLNEMWTKYADIAKETPQDSFAGVSLIVPRPSGA